jgi:hypothetical protein
MVNNAIVVPCAILGSIAVGMFAFICWWFPRAWAKGQTADMREHAARRQRDLELATSDVATDENTDISGGEPGVRKISATLGRSAYVPPVVTPY